MIVNGKNNMNYQKKAAASSKSSRSTSKSSGKSSKSSKSSSGDGLKVNSSNNTEVTKLSNDIIAVKKPDGSYATLNITPNATDKQIYEWGKKQGVDLRDYGLDLKV